MNRSLCIATSIILFLVLSTVPVWALEYSVVGLGVTSPVFIATDLNESGAVTGNGDQQSFIWEAGGLTEIQPLSDGAWSEALGINGSGQVVGAGDSGIGTQAIVWDLVNGTTTGLADIDYWGELYGGVLATAINDSGIIAGACRWYPSYADAACFWNGTWQDVHWQGASSRMEDVNDAGHFVGSSVFSNGYYAGFYGTTTNGIMTVLDQPVNGINSSANALNGADEIVGYCETLDYPQVGCFWQDTVGRPVVMGVLPGAGDSVAYDINDAGQAVGTSGGRAFLWGRYMAMSDLNDMLDASSQGWTLAEATAINNQGQIVGLGTNPTGVSESFLLTPVGDNDVDGDGYIFTQDCNDNDPAIYPGAVEVKHDGIDQDCNGYDLTIDIIKVDYNDRKDTLTVEATSSHGAAADLRLAEAWLVTMTWNERKNKWTKVVENMTADPVTVRVYGFEGSETGYTGEPPCVPVPEICDDGNDNDCDGLADGADPECPSLCNGNGICDPGEDCLQCPDECAGKTKGKPSSQFCCGNGVPEGSEDAALCDDNY